MMPFVVFLHHRTSSGITVFEYKRRFLRRDDHQSHGIESFHRIAEVFGLFSSSAILQSPDYTQKMQVPISIWEEKLSPFHSHRWQVLSPPAINTYEASDYFVLLVVDVLIAFILCRACSVINANGSFLVYNVCSQCNECIKYMKSCMVYTTRFILKLNECLTITLLAFR
jgi:hypothetical protein